MAAEGDNDFMRYVYRGEEGEIIPREATHITVGEDCTVIRTSAFQEHPNIVEIICHDKVEKIERSAFFGCPNLRRIIMPGVKIAEDSAFSLCESLSDIDCGKLEIIGEGAFCQCRSLRSLNLPYTRIVECSAFYECDALTNVKFGSKLENINGEVFLKCSSLERITIPLKDGLITSNDIFQGCGLLKNVDLVEGELHETIAALHLEEWKNDVSEEIGSIYRILPNARAGYWDDDDEERFGDPGEKGKAIRTWIRSVLGKIIRYQVEHHNILGEAATSSLQFASPQDFVMNNGRGRRKVLPSQSVSLWRKLRRNGMSLLQRAKDQLRFTKRSKKRSTFQLTLPRDIVINNILPFLELPSHTFEVEEEDDEEDSRGSSSDGWESASASYLEDFSFGGMGEDELEWDDDDASFMLYALDNVEGLDPTVASEIEERLRRTGHLSAR